MDVDVKTNADVKTEVPMIILADTIIPADAIHLMVMEHLADAAIILE